MSNTPCPHCGAKPYVQGKLEGIQARCDACNGLISVPESNADQAQEQDIKTASQEQPEKSGDQ